MPTYSIWQNYANAGLNHLTTGSGVNHGVRFHPTVDGYIEKLRWYYHGGTSNNRRPASLTLWDDANRTVLAQVIPAPTDGAAQTWTDYTLLSPLFVPANKVLCVSAQYPGTGGAVWSYWAIPTANFPTIPAALALEVNHAATVAGGTQHPTTHTATITVALDIVFNTEFEQTNSGAPATVGSTRNELAAWLDEDDFTEPDSMVALAWATLQTMETVIYAIEAKLDIVDGILDAALGPTGQLLTGAVKGYLDNLAGMIDDVQAAVGPYINDHTTAAKTEILNAVAAIPTAPPPGFPLTVGDADWTEVDQTVGSGGYAWAQPADAYKITVEEVGDEVRSARQIGTETIYWLRAWARPWDGVSVYTPTHELVGLSAVVMTDQRWPGIMVYFPPGVEWTITAYNYDPVPF